MELVCPFCQHGLSEENRHCQSCGGAFSPDDWPEEAISSKGLAPTLSLKFEGDVWQAARDDFTIGRNVGIGGMQIKHPSVSSEHVRIYRRGNAWIAERLKGVLLWNGEERESIDLASGGILSLGACALGVEILYKRVSPPTDVEGVLKSETFLDWRNKNQIRIGSDGARCNIVISDIDPIHAIIYRHARTGDWWIVDCASRSGTQLNKQQIQNSRLYPGDVVRVASVPIVVSEGGLSIGNTSGNGFLMSVDRLSASIGKNQILNDVSFLIKPGEFLGVLGPSGCGKSSLIQRLVGLGRVSGGTILVDRLEVQSARTNFLRKTAYLPQQTALHPALTLEQECDSFCRIHCASFNEGKRKILPSLRLVGLESEGKKRIRSLSGGQKRRAGIALELLRSPRLLLLDEPTSGLDPATEADVMNYLRRIADQGKSVVCSTHMMENVDMFDKILLLSRGCAVFFGKPSDVLRYFGAKSLPEVFRMLAEGSADDQTQRAKELSQKLRHSPYFPQIHSTHDASLSALDAKKAPSVPISQEILGYLHRYVQETFSFAHSPTPWRSFWQSPIFVWMILQPFLISQAIKLSCATKFFGFGEDTKALFFFALLSMFWLGMNHSIRELVAERVPHRCLERLRQVSFSGYIWSKLAVSFVLCAVQTALFSIFFFALPYYHVHGLSELDAPNAIIWTWGLSATLFFACLMGSWIALALSAFSTNENAAVGALPLVLIPVLLFSSPVINHEETFDKYFNAETGGKYSKPAIYLEWLSPCHQPLVLMSALNDRQHALLESQERIDNNHKKVRRSLASMCINTYCWLLFSFIALIYFQYQREQSWEGR
ncbi:MAG: ATP-binding cassette domain-containing protein [Planctomycetia bacterium]|nr:ATP-binding cassette domain-containing protein [Planctomycetia bacterium]